MANVPISSSLPKIAQLVVDAKAYLDQRGISTAGKRSDQILTMAREERNKPVPAKPR